MRGEQTRAGSNISWPRSREPWAGPRARRSSIHSPIPRTRGQRNTAGQGKTDLAVKLRSEPTSPSMFAYDACTTRPARTYRQVGLNERHVTINDRASQTRELRALLRCRYRKSAILCEWTRLEVMHDSCAGSLVPDEMLGVTLSCFARVSSPLHASQCQTPHAASTSADPRRAA
jgi:hypothetical protein